MKYLQFLRENLDGYRLMNGLQVADLGCYEDRHIWLCYHPQDYSKTQIAIELTKEGKGKGYDIVSSTEMPIPKVKIIENVPYVENINIIKPYCVAMAKFIYDMDNNLIRFK